MSLYRSFVDKPLPTRSKYRELAGKLYRELFEEYVSREKLSEKPMAHETSDGNLAYLSQVEVDALLQRAGVVDKPPDVDFWIRHYEREIADIDDMARTGECRKREIGHFLNVLKGLK